MQLAIPRCTLHPSTSMTVLETIQAKAKKLLQSNQAKIQETADQLEQLHEKVKLQQQTHAEMKEEVKNMSPENPNYPLAMKNVRDMQKSITDNMRDAEDLIAKMDRLGDKQQATAIKQKFDDLYAHDYVKGLKQNAAAAAKL
jgi:uncharacterized coiled-coil DUF342 family protein